MSPPRDSASLILLGSIPLSKVNSEPRCLSKGVADAELHPDPRPKQSLWAASSNHSWARPHGPEVDLV